MKRFKTIAVLLLCMGFLFSTTSCVVLVKENNGKHKGWFKNPNNPHHPYSTNPGKSKGNHKR
jgi:ABC-type oligopeptide transport system substrate-binding subunit